MTWEDTVGRMSREEWMLACLGKVRFDKWLAWGKPSHCEFLLREGAERAVAGDKRKLEGIPRT
jgi:hypothetical protein